jgi:hypothetical protein
MNAIGIFTIFEDNALFLKNLNYLNVFTIPLYSLNQNSYLNNNKLESSTIDLYGQEKIEKFYKYDILFFGSCSKRRMKIINKLLAEIENTDNNHIKIKHHLRCVQNWSQILMDKELDFYVKNSKIVINIHTEKTSSLEVHRINYLLSMKKIIISERSLNNVELDLKYENAVVFIDNVNTDLYDMIELLLSNPDECENIEKNAFEMYDSIMNDLIDLDIAVKHIFRILAN